MRAVAVLVGAWAIAASPHARAEDAATPPAVRYAALDRDACEAELTKRGAPFQRVDAARGVLAPVRLTGPLRGVTFHSPLREEARASSPLEIVDCRLVLALDDFAGLLTKYDVTEAVHLSMYRAPRARKGHPWPDGKLGKRHGAALAIDAAIFRRKDGTTLDVQRDFHGRIGARTCGPGARGPSPATPEALALRGIACDAADAHLFNVELTPDYNRKHRNHFHLEVTPAVTWFLVR